MRPYAPTGRPDHRHFNPRIPYGMRHELAHIKRDRRISIHASRMGCDDTRRQDGRPQVNFNPRIPYGMRLFVGVAAICTCVFQSTHPVWDATRKKTADALTIYFNPRIPYGMRRQVKSVAYPKVHFNPRIPYGMRLPSADLIIRES